MSRNTVDSCLFCGHVHSGNCGGTPPKPKLSKVERVRPEKKAPPAVQASEPTKPAAPAASARPNLAAVQRVRNPEEEQLAYAITLFAERDMLGAEGLREHRRLIRLPDNQIDAMIWKEENREQVASSGVHPHSKVQLPAGVHGKRRSRESSGLP